MVRAVALILVLLVLPTAVMAQDNQFDLICKGVEKTLGSLKGATEQDKTVRYRIDLGAKRWCEGECATGLKIQEVTPDAIILVDGRNPPPIAGTEHHVISRASGDVQSTISAGSIFIGFNGSCQKAPFTPFPATKF